MGNVTSQPFMPGCCEKEEHRRMLVSKKSARLVPAPLDPRLKTQNRRNSGASAVSPGARNSPRANPRTPRTPRTPAVKEPEEGLSLDCMSPCTNGEVSKEERIRRKGMVAYEQQRRELKLVGNGGHSEARSWSLAIDLVSARNIPENLPGFHHSSLVMCLSAIRTDVQPDDAPGSPSTHSTIPPLHASHDMTLQTSAATPRRPDPGQPFVLERPQFRSRRKDSSSVVFFSERYHCVEAHRGLELLHGAWAQRRMDEPKVLGGGVLVLFFSLHQIERDGTERMVGGAPLHVRPCAGQDMTLYLQAPAGGQLASGSAPCAISVRVSYGDGAAGAADDYETPRSARGVGSADMDGVVGAAVMAL